MLLGKVGYGTVSEAVAHLKPFVWVRRDYFNEQVSEPPPMAIDGAPGDLMDRH